METLILLGLLLMPLLGALVIFLLPNNRLPWIRLSALISAVITLGISLYLLSYFDGNGFTSVDFTVQWNKNLGTHFALGVDGFSYPMIVLTTLLSLAAIVVSSNITKQTKGYYALLLLLEFATLGVFIAQDWALFYVFWELVLIPLFFLIDGWGGKNRQSASLNFVLYTMGGSVFILLSLLVLFDATTDHSFTFEAIRQGATSLEASEQLFVFLGLLIGFGVKMPIFPLHGWLPLAHVEAPSPVSIMLSGILLKMGAYGLIRAVDILPLAAHRLQLFLLSVGLISLIYGALLAWRQRDMKCMVAYSSVSHMGVVMIGISTLNQAGLTGAMYQMVAHGLVASVLFMLIGLLYERTKTRNIDDYRSLITITPRFAFLLTVALIANIAMPSSAGFIAELHVLIGGFQQWGGLIALMMWGMMITAVYSIHTIKQLYTGTESLSFNHINDLSKQETAIASLLIVLVFVLGFYPTPLLAIIDDSITNLMVLFMTATTQPDLFVPISLD